MKTVKIKNEHLVPVYIENVTMILERLAKYRSQQASFVYRHPEHRWLLRPPGYQPSIESRVLEKVLKQLGALVEVDRSASRKRFIVRVKPIRAALRSRKKLYRLVHRLLLQELEEKTSIIKAHSWKRWLTQP